MKKHSNLCRNLENRLKQKSYVIDTWLEIEYKLGECDVLTTQGNRFVYYEVKSNYNSKSLEKAKKQLVRWSNYWHKKHKKDCYGVYYSPTKIILLAKNGYLK